MKTCLFSGTFDPPHFGHLIVAQTIFEAEHFDQIVFVPANIPPHKRENKISSVDLRIEMLKIATKDNPNFFISDIDIVDDASSDDNFHISLRIYSTIPKFPYSP